ncbi:GA-binding protein subunit beta-1-like [Contarinia nasturtii]|uniref:GA-binding protein subunit beta-1-like n=1 Tax=Contarinia nasturtii TaxID=265458 RepID=UPI0012D3F25D|nr:GA-binding protein subunit beta-1-like [Contarinia nasturtii]
MAAKKGYLRIVELLLKAGADINIQTNDKQTSLYIATSAGHEDVVSMLLEKGADVNIQEIYGSAPLHKAVEISFVEIIGCLRRKGANVHLKNGKNESAYDIAVKQGNKTIIDILVPSMKPWKKLHKAARDGK